MGMTFHGAQELKDDITGMADALRDSGGNGGRAVNFILQSAAKPILEKMLENARSSPIKRSGDLYNSIKIGKVVRGKNGRYRIRVGVFHSEKGAYYAVPVEFGHGGPHGPAAPRPFVRPAFDAEVGNAYEQMKEDLRTALDKRGLL